MTDPRIRLKNSILAAVLGLLIPGLGHAYQGRYFKAILYCVCILGLFLTGMAMAGWQAIQTPTLEATKNRQVTPFLKYAAQLPVGAPVMLAWVQRTRLYDQETNISQTEIPAPMTAPLTGTVHLLKVREPKKIEGTIELKPFDGQYGRRGITGEIHTTIDGQPAVLKLSDSVKLDEPVQGIKQRTVHGDVLGEGDQIVGNFRVQIPRPVKDWLGVPMNDNQEQELHRQLGKFHELAMVFTWVAGLLNILAVWDAIEGPAYGYDMQSLQPEKQPATPA